MEMTSDLLIDEVMLKRFEKDKEIIRVYNVKLGVPCEWVVIKLEDLDRIIKYE